MPTGERVHGQKRPKSKSPSKSPCKRGKNEVTNEEILSTLLREFAESRAEQKKEFSAIKKHLGALDDRVTVLEKSAHSASSQITYLRNERDLILDEVRRPNLLIHGFPENETSREQLIDEVNKLIAETLGLSAKVDELYRLAKRSAEKIPPIKIKFQLLSDRNAVLKAAREKLRGQEVYVTEDLAPSTRLSRKKAYEKKTKSGGPIHNPPA